ncbi:metallophosphoesterase family protein [Jiulongibacter sp. NS-SX5]|uniref:metallophosphoesterase family protein n=1 Tax=Jiulongibacter sp. NS-SX5 TaxID=3463854 RepID=UPI004057DE0F
MKTNRREFIKNASSLAALSLLPGVSIPNLESLLKKRPAVRIILASDSHYGQPKTDFKGMAQTFVQKANAFAKVHDCDYCILNGDLIHDEPTWLPEAKSVYDDLDIPFFVTKGNHDRVSDEVWEQTWGIPTNTSFTVKKNGFILANTSNENGDYHSPDLNWLKQELDAFVSLKNVFLVIHIPQAKWTANGIETPEFFELLSNYSNVKAVFHGHEHDQDGVRNHEGISYVFDSHIGGSWGTEYRGFRVLEVSKGGDVYTYMMNPDLEISRDEL